MTRPETELLTALYVLYANECVFWLKPGERAYTRDGAGSWKLWQIGAHSFTLRARAAAVSSPLLWRAAFLRRAAEAPDADSRALTRTARRLDGMSTLTWFCRLQAIVLLLYGPAIVLLHQMERLWPLLAGIILLNHAVLLAFLSRELRRYVPGRVLPALAPVLLNPVGALRSLDVLTPLVFARLESQRRRRTLEDGAPIH